MISPGQKNEISGDSGERAGARDNSKILIFSHERGLCDGKKTQKSQIKQDLIDQLERQGIYGAQYRT